MDYANLIKPKTHPEKLLAACPWMVPSFVCTAKQKCPWLAFILPLLPCLIVK
jgi:hypothetical protein